MPEESALINGRKQTDPESLRRIFAYAFRVATIRSGSNRSSLDEAQDIAQETVLLLLKKVSDSGLPETIQSDQQLQRFISGAVRNRWIGRFRSSSRRSAERIELEAVDAALAEDPDPEVQFSNIEQRDQLKQAMQQLSIRDREILVLRYLQELSVDEIATELHIPRASVNGILYRAIR